MTIKLNYNAPAELQKLMDQCARAWMEALSTRNGGVTGYRCLILPAESLREANVMVKFGPVDRCTSPTRVAQHELRHGIHFITLADDVKWRITKWQRFIGLGQEDAYAALLHETGHAIGLPHSSRESDVMAPTLGTTVISQDEALGYRRYLDTPPTQRLNTLPRTPAA